MQSGGSELLEHSRAQLRFGVHSGQQYGTFAECLALWQRAEALDYDWVSVFDHFRPPVGGPGGPCLEGTTLLSALAARTSRVRCGMLVLGAHYRHPALVANIASTLDHVSGGRLELGLGAGSDDLAHAQYGIRLPPIAERLERLEELCHVVRRLCEEESVSFEGRHVQLRDARLSPAPLQRRLPIVIGGSGEQRMLRIVARHADIWNTMAGDLELLAHKRDVLARHCREEGRDPETIRTSVMFRVVLGDTEREAEDTLRAMVGDLPADAPQRKAYLVVGTPEQCIERLLPYVRMRVGDFLLGIRPPIDWRTMELFAQRVVPALRR